MECEWVCRSNAKYCKHTNSYAKCCCKAKIEGISLVQPETQQDENVYIYMSLSVLAVVALLVLTCIICHKRYVTYWPGLLLHVSDAEVEVVDFLFLLKILIGGMIL